MENSLNTINQLKKESKIGPVGNTKYIQLASIHAYTANGDFVNVSYRYNPKRFGEYNTRAIKHINEGLDKLRKLPQRKIVNERVYSGKTFSKTDFEEKFVGAINRMHLYNGYMSTTKLETLAEGFIALTMKWASNEKKLP